MISRLLLSVLLLGCAAPTAYVPLPDAAMAIDAGMQVCEAPAPGKWHFVFYLVGNSNICKPTLDYVVDLTQRSCNTGCVCLSDFEVSTTACDRLLSQTCFNAEFGVTTQLDCVYKITMLNVGVEGDCHVVGKNSVDAVLFDCQYGSMGWSEP